MRFPRIALLSVAFVLLTLRALGQSPNGNINGLVLDPTNRVIAGAEIVAANDVTGVQFTTKTNDEGVYVLANLPPGPYRLQVSKVGFKTIIKPDITLNVQDALSINFTLPVGALLETVTVEGGAPLINAQNAAVSTVIDRKFAESLPLNGRSFNTLLQLTPGVVLAPSSSSSQGQFSVSGQRTSSNNFLVDGVSANFGVSPAIGLGTSGTGTAQAFSALGGTSSLVSVEALQEFRIETSSFAPEFGRSTGGQVLLTTKSGTNVPHGGIYEYFRNDVLDANDWFANAAGKPRAAERHNDFGGFLGGPLQRDRTFFFLSYEGARLRQPNASTTQVPSEYARQAAASGPVAPFLDAYPEPDDKTVVPGVYAASFTGSFSNPASLDAGSVRIDHTFNGKLSVFGRYNQAPSDTSTRSNSLNYVTTTNVATRTLTFSGVMTFNPQLANTFRANHSLQDASLAYQLDSFGGATVPSLNILAPGLTSPGHAVVSFYDFDTGYYVNGPDAKNRSAQLDFADDLSIVHKTHQLKFGADYRAIYLDLRPATSILSYQVSSLPLFLETGQASVFGQTSKPAYFLSRSTSIYAQDTWKVTSRLTLTYGIRWEFSPAPAPRSNTTLAAWENVGNPSALTLAASGTPAWSTSYTDFAPRIGLAYSLTRKGDLVVRAGWGLFYEAGADSAGYLGASFPNNASQSSPSASLPLADATQYLPAISLEPPYPDGALGFAPNLRLPRSYQWNAAIEKSFSGKQAVSLTYVGQIGRSLLRQEGLTQPNQNFDGVFLLTTNDAHSNYNALEVQYRRPLSDRLHALINYTWSHSLDNASDDVVTAVSNSVISSQNDYASSAFDVRHSFSGAVTLEVPAAAGAGVLGHVTRGWSLEALVVARSGFPFNAIAPIFTIANALPRPDVVPGQPYYLYGSQCIAVLGPPCAGGRGLNPAAFSFPEDGQQGTERRNDIPGFGFTQVDFSLARKFAMTDHISLQFRADAFNVFNHPNFTNPVGLYLGPGYTPFLQSTQMLNHGLGGLNPLFQEGGPRSLQLSLRLSF